MAGVWGGIIHNPSHAQALVSIREGLLRGEGGGWQGNCREWGSGQCFGLLACLLACLLGGDSSAEEGWQGVAMDKKTPLGYAQPYYLVWRGKGEGDGWQGNCREGGSGQRFGGPRKRRRGGKAWQGVVGVNNLCKNISPMWPLGVRGAAPLGMRGVQGAAPLWMRGVRGAAPLGMRGV